MDEIAAARPAIWGGLVKVLQKCLVELKKYKPQHTTHRLADFANFAIAIGPAIGVPRKNIKKILDAMEAEKTDFAIENNATLNGLVRGLSTWLKYKGMAGRSRISTGDLHKEVLMVSENENVAAYIGNARSFGVNIKNLQTELQSYFDIKGPTTGRSNTKLYAISEKRKHARKY